jgi:hypothetical protein
MLASPPVIDGYRGSRVDFDAVPFRRKCASVFLVATLAAVISLVRSTSDSPQPAATAVRTVPSLLPVPATRTRIPHPEPRGCLRLS